VQVISGVVAAEGTYLMGMIRTVADDLLSQRRSDVQRIVSSRLAGSGLAGAPPLEVPTAVPVQASAIRQVAAVPPSPGTFRPFERRTLEMGRGASTAHVQEIQTFSTRPGHIRVIGPGQYQHMEPILGQLGTGPQAAAALTTFQTAGILSRSVAGTPQNLQVVAQLTRLASVEAARDPADLVRRAMLLDMLSRGTINREQFINTMNAMAPGGATKTAAFAQTVARPGAPFPYSTQPTRAQIQEFIATERQVMASWLYARMASSELLFTNEQEVRRYIRTKLDEYIRNLVRGAYGV
jgi:hypothetical protein